MFGWTCSLNKWSPCYCPPSRYLHWSTFQIQVPCTGFFDLWIFEPRHGPDILSDVPYLLIRRLKPPMPVVWTISRSLDDQNTYVVAYTNALSGNNLTCCIHQVAAGTTVWHALRKLAFVLSRLKQCSPFQRFISANTSIERNALMFETDPTGVAESTLGWTNYHH